VNKDSGSHGGEDDVGLLGCNVMWTCKEITVFPRKIDTK
jgi:hypothetical protein